MNQQVESKKRKVGKDSSTTVITGLIRLRYGVWLCRCGHPA